MGHEWGRSFHICCCKAAYSGNHWLISRWYWANWSKCPWEYFSVSAERNLLATSPGVPYPTANESCSKWRQKIYIFNSMTINIYQHELQIHGNKVHKFHKNNLRIAIVSALAKGSPCCGAFLPRPFAGRTSETIGRTGTDHDVNPVPESKGRRLAHRPNLSRLNDAYIHTYTFIIYINLLYTSVMFRFGWFCR